MGRGSRRLSVCVPYYRAPRDVLLRALRSAHEALPSGCELLVVPSDDEAGRRLGGLRLPRSAQVLAPRGTLDLVGNWNRCLTETEGELVHLLHDDDAVTAEFYDSILALAERYPSAGLYGTLAASLEHPDDSRGDEAGPRAPAPSVLLAGDDAARFLLTDDRHGCGNIVLVRSVVERSGLFRAEFPYCPDEEAYLRYASDGGLALTLGPYYREGASDANARLATWSRDDFVPVYWRSRRDGAARFSDETAQLAARSSTRRVVSIVMTLATLGRRREAAEMLHALRGEDVPVAVCWRIWIARLMLSLRLSQLVTLRRRFLRGPVGEQSA